MTRRLLVVVAVLGLVSTTAYAGIYGTLTGKVLDKDKKPVSGATVRVLGTSRGGITKGDGKYTIVNINAGKWDVRVTAVGYDTAVRTGVEISADETVNLNFSLTQGGGVLMKDVVIQGEREMVRKDAVGTTQKLSSATLQSMAIDNVAGIVGRQAGVESKDGGFVIRGSRSTETQVLVDGLTVTDQFTGGLGNTGGAFSTAMPSPFATEEVQTQTGGFGAEYGNAIGGIVNTVVKTGRTDRFEGLVRMAADVPFMWGTAGNGVEAGSPQQTIVDVTLGGPLGLANSTFFIAVRNQYQNYRNFGLQVKDPIGNNLGQLPNNRTWSRNLTGRLKLGISDKIFLLVGGMYGTGSFERSGWGWLYANDQGQKVDGNGNAILDGNGQVQFNGVPERAAKQLAIQEYSNNAFAQINHTLTQNSFYELRVSINNKTTEISKRKNGDAPGLLSGFDLYQPEDNLKIEGDKFVAGADRILDAWGIVRPIRYTSDTLARYEQSVRNEITGYVEGQGDAFSTSNPYGLQNYFNARGNEGGVDFRSQKFWQFDGSITNNIEIGETRHIVKAGAELRLFRFTRHSNSNPWDGLPFYDVYGPDFGGNLYADEVQGIPASTIKAQSEVPYTPTTAGLFVQDQILFKGLVFTPGLRLDYLNADAMYRTQFVPFVPFGSTEGFADTKAKLYISPRISIAYPISERQNIRLSYGIYYQAPPWNDFYDGFNSILIRGQALGNPNMEMQRTNQYEVSYNHQLSDNLAITLTGYYKDIYNQSGLAFVRAVPDAYYQQILADYGNNRGIEFTFQKRMMDNWALTFNYVLASAQGTAVSSGVAVALDPYTGNPAFPVTDFPLDNDRRHRVNANFTMQWNQNEGPAISGVHFLQYFNVNISGTYNSGLPYTPVNGQGQAVGEINSARFPSTWASEMRISRRIPLQELLGGNTSLELFMDVTNLLNLTDPVSFYTRTGSPDYDGNALNRIPGDFPSTTFFRDGDPSRKETFNSAQYDRVGERLYSAAADINNDGLQTPDETYAGYQRYVDTVVSRRGNYQYPRQVYFGVTFRF